MRYCLLITDGLNLLEIGVTDSQNSLCLKRLARIRFKSSIVTFGDFHCNKWPSGNTFSAEFSMSIVCGIGQIEAFIEFLARALITVFLNIFLRC